MRGNGLRAASSKLRVAGLSIWDLDMGFGIEKFELTISGYGLRVTGYELRVTSCGQNEQRAKGL
jgi:hypothetical protein